MVTVLAFVTIAEDQPQALAEYFRLTGPLLDRVGARIVRRFAVTEAVVGRGPSRTVVIVDYPSRAAVDAVFLSPDYAAAIPARDRAFLDYAITVVDDVHEVAARQEQSAGGHG